MRRALLGTALGATALANRLEQLDSLFGRVLRVDAEAAERIQAAVQIGETVTENPDRGK